MNGNAENGVNGVSDRESLTVVVFGATGDLARKKTFPALFQLFKKGLLPKNLRIFAYGRSYRTTDELISKNFKSIISETQGKAFVSMITYVSGQYSKDGFNKDLKTEIEVTFNRFTD